MMWGREQLWVLYAEHNSELYIHTPKYTIFMFPSNDKIVSSIHLYFLCAFVHKYRNWGPPEDPGTFERFISGRQSCHSSMNRPWILNLSLIVFITIITIIDVGILVQISLLSIKRMWNFSVFLEKTYQNLNRFHNIQVDGCCALNQFCLPSNNFIESKKEKKKQNLWKLLLFRLILKMNNSFCVLFGLFSFCKTERNIKNHLVWHTFGIKKPIYGKEKIMAGKFPKV